MVPFLVILASLQAAADPSLAEVEQAVVAPRKAIRRGIIGYEIVNYSTDPSRSDSEVDNTFWFDLDKGKKRVDRVHRKKAPTQVGEYPDRQIDCRNCERDGYRVDYLQDRRRPQEYLRLYPLGRMTAAERKGFEDPRLLGIVPSPTVLLYDRPFEDFIGMPNREGLTFQKDSIKGLDCWHVSFRYRPNPNIKADFHADVWIVPQQGYSVARVLVKAQLPSGLMETVFETEPQPVAGTGLWFPARISLSSTKDGKFLDKEVVRVTRVSLNEPVDDAVFTLAGMDIPEGTPIRAPDKKGQIVDFVWKDGVVVRQDAPPPPTLTSVPGADPARHSLYTSLAIAFAGAGILTFAIYFFRRRARAA